jgi:dTDP-4-amino-4,6-dideoxygalactose transaminase
MLNTPFSPWPAFSVEEADAVRNLLLTNRVNYWTGTEGREFENQFAAYTGSSYAIALANGTVALDVALNALGIQPDDEVIVTPRTFIASISSIVNAGAIPVFADVDLDSGNVTAETILAVLTDRTKAVICVHLAGWPCDMDPIMRLAERNDLHVIEDCAQAHGASYKGRNVGSIGDIGVWSFCQDKIISTGGEGGMVTTNNENLWSRMWSYKDHGKSWEAIYVKEHPVGYRWVHESFGTNWRMTEMQAAIGRIQLGRLEDWHSARVNNTAQILKTCQQFPSVFRVSVPDAKFEHAYYKCYVNVRPDVLSVDWSRDCIIEAINSRGVPCYSGTCSEVYLEKAFDRSGFRPGCRLPGAKELGETSLMFLVHPTMTGDEIQKTCNVISEVAVLACKECK